MIFGWLFLIVMIVINLVSSWLTWGDPVLQKFVQSVSLMAIVLVAFGLGMGYRADEDDTNIPYN